MNLHGNFDQEPHWQARLSHSIRKSYSGECVHIEDTDEVRRRIANTPLPKPREQIENLLLYFGHELDGLGDYLENINPEDLIATIGARDRDNAYYVFRILEDQDLAEIERNMTPYIQSATLTYRGWEIYHELSEHRPDSDRAFMAMPFNKPELDKFFYDHLKPEVKKTGYNLLRVDENAKAGSIVNRMKVEIRASRFLVAELAYMNPGAYWEAGFAEGLGIPVFYTCSKTWHKQHESEVHFDIRQDLIVFWEDDKMQEAAEELKLAIRSTLPDETVQEDPSFD